MPPSCANSFIWALASFYHGRPSNTSSLSHGLWQASLPSRLLKPFVQSPSGFFLFLWNLFLPDTYNDSGYCQTGENPSFMDVNTTMNETPTCPAVGYQSASICVPVTVTPFAQTGITTTKCCGSPVVTSGREVCNGVRNGSCVFTISQDICVAVPVEFGAVASVGDSSTSCNGASDQDICTGCGEVRPFPRPLFLRYTAQKGSRLGAFPVICLCFRSTDRAPRRKKRRPAGIR